MNMKMGRVMKGKNSFKKDKMNMRWNEGQDETLFYKHSRNRVSQMRYSVL